MRRTTIIGILVLLHGAVFAQTLPRVKKLDDYWPEGKKKTYSFTVDGQEVGRLDAKMDDIREVDGRQVYEIREDLSLDLSKQIEGFLYDISEKVRVNSSAYFLNAEASVRVGERQEEIRARLMADSGKVIFDRGKDEPGIRTVKVEGPVYAADNYMLDELEMILAMQDLTPGKSFTVPVVSPQGMYGAEYEFTVVGRSQAQYGPFTDSVWQINLVRPSEATIYIDREHLLVKYIDPAQKLTAELARNPFENRRQPAKSITQRIDDQISRTPIYGFFLLISVIWLIFLGRDSYRLHWSYILFVIGMIMYPITLITQVPLQQWYAIQVMAPALSKGQSILVPAIVPSLLTGFIQETLKFIPLFIIARSTKIKPLALISVGAFIGAGFGFAEACHIAGPVFQARALTSVTLVDRIFAVLLHIVLGAGMAYGIARRKTWQFWLVAVGLHSFATYMVVFVQLKVVTIKALQVILVIYDLMLLAAMMFLQTTFKRAHAKGKKGRR